MVAGNGNGLGTEDGKGAINNVEIKKGDVVSLGQEGTMLCPFEVCRIGGREGISFMPSSNRA